ncbi:MAG: MFS transporter, partial [Thermomicrobiaceae bacterium]|nr:MFS transporter [Thermomicrobiaceae bacterium]
MRGGRLGAYPVYLIMRGASALLYATVFTLSAVYRVEVAHLGPLELTLVGTALESAVFLGEVPTGVVADVYSRRLSIVIGLALVGAGFMLEGALPIFATILLAQVLWGVGYTFTSGADSAWIADELGEERATEVFLRGAQASHVGALVGIGLSVLLGSVRLNLPLLAAGALFWALAAFLALAMPEHHFTPAPREGRETRRAMAATLRGGAREVRRRPVLVTLLATGAIYGMASEGFDRLYAIHFLRDLRLPALDG